MSQNPLNLTPNPSNQTISDLRNNSFEICSEPSYRHQFCFICDMPKYNWTLTAEFGEIICYACINTLGCDRLKLLIPKIRLKKETTRKFFPYCRQTNNPPPYPYTYLRDYLARPPPFIDPLFSPPNTNNPNSKRVRKDRSERRTTDSVQPDPLNLTVDTENQNLAAADTSKP